MMNRNRVISGLIAVIYLVVAAAHGGIESALQVGICLILPVSCIWFAEAMGGYVGPAATYAITKASPGLIVCILGWLLLLLPLLLAIGSVLF
jgi:hypothetical protein